MSLFTDWDLDKQHTTARILVADDDPDLRLVLGDILASQGYEVIVAQDGEDALAKAWSERPDLIVLDVMMPKLNGYAVCRLLKADRETAHIPVLMLTSLGDPDDRTKGLNLGADDYLPKPFHYNELTARVAARVRAKRAEDHLRAREQHIRATFARYVVPKVVDRLLMDPTGVHLGGAQQELTVFFADLRGFTALAEQTPPEELVHLLNGYLNVAAKAVLAFEGMLDKFMGDAVMALFNVPSQQDDHARRALGAAWLLQQQLAGYHQQVPEARRLFFSVGVHSGEAVVGNIGSSDLVNFTAVGDTVNLAKRIQERAGAGEILISEQTYRLVADLVDAQLLGTFPLRGRRENVAVYQVVDCRVVPWHES
jgi:class 3 adenylate cyclase